MIFERRAHAPAPPVLTRRVALATLGTAGLGLLLAGCGTTAGQPRSAAPAASLDFAARFAAFTPAEEPNGDLAMVVWPEWITGADPEIKQLYEFQLVNGDLMRWMPCFCGCHRGDGHRNNRDCYIEAVNPDGSVVFDSMAPT